MSNLIKKLPMQFNGAEVGHLKIFDDGAIVPMFDESEEAVQCMFFLVHMALHQILDATTGEHLDIELSLN